jgi:hypothetical protein
MVNARGFSFELNPVLTADNLVAFAIRVPDGRHVEVWGEVELQGRHVTVRQFAIYGIGFAATELGLTLLREMARAALEAFDVDTIRIDAARRTSGANPGRTAASIEFRRETRAADS